MKKLSFFLMAMLMSVMSFAAEINLDFTKIDGFSSWKNSYSEHVVEYDDATVTFTAASRQTGTITTQPVTKGQPVEVVMKNDITLSGVTFACTQWGSKAQTITLHYSVDGGKNYTSTGITSTDFNISSEELPLGTNAVKLTFSSSSSQIGIASCTLVTVEANPDAPKYMVTATPSDEAMGTVTGGGEYGEGSVVTLTATPKAGYKFVNWSNGSTDNPLVLEVTEDVNITANFAAKDVYTITWSVNGETTTTSVVEGEALVLPEAPEAPEACSEKVFVGWTTAEEVNADGSDITWVDETVIPTNSVTYYAVFATVEGEEAQETSITKTVKEYAEANSWANETQYKTMVIDENITITITEEGTYHNSGKYYLNGNNWRIYQNETPTLTFSAQEGTINAVTTEYTYKNGGVLTHNGTNVTSGTEYKVEASTITFGVGSTEAEQTKGNVQITEITVVYTAQVNIYTDYSTTCVAPVVNHTITVSANPAEGGVVTGGDEYEEGATAILTATANEGYEFVNWTKGEEVVSTENSYTFVVTADVALVANFAVVEPEVITYELNGGELVVEVPTQEELWASFKTAAGLTTLGTLAEITEAGAGKPHNDPDNPCACRIICAKLLDANVNAVFALPEWAWLKAYIMTVQSGLPEASSSPWRYAIAAFFLQSQHSAYPASADFTEAGKPEAWGAAYQAAHAVVLPTEPVDAPYTLPTPVKDGFTFVGWYDNAEGTGEAYTVIPAGWAGTLYAIWEQGTTTALENIAVEGKAVKAIVNGQLIIIKNGVQYNAQGAVVK